jgi:hypothetical protein
MHSAYFNFFLLTIVFTGKLRGHFFYTNDNDDTFLLAPKASRMAICQSFLAPFPYFAPFNHEWSRHQRWEQMGRRPKKTGKPIRTKGKKRDTIKACRFAAEKSNIVS